jgi:mannose-6-phosphate isomerase-like protein (cupin superfamily)
MNEKIVYQQTDETKEFSTEERCHIIELLNSTQDRTSSLARARVESGVTTAWHALKDTAEIYYILEGTGKVELGENYTQELSKGDILKIPSNTAQRITNTGIDDLVFLCFCTPAFGEDTYEDLE